MKIPDTPSPALKNSISTPHNGTYLDHLQEMMRHSNGIEFIFGWNIYSISCSKEGEWTLLWSGTMPKKRFALPIAVSANPTTYPDGNPIEKPAGTRYKDPDEFLQKSTIGGRSLYDIFSHWEEDLESGRTFRYSRRSEFTLDDVIKSMVDSVMGGHIVVRKGKEIQYVVGIEDAIGGWDLYVMFPTDPKMERAFVLAGISNEELRNVLKHVEIGNKSLRDICINYANEPEIDILEDHISFE